MSHNNWTESADLYTIGTLQGIDALRFETHLKEGCLECLERVQKNEEALASLVATQAQLMPSSSVKAAVLERIDQIETARLPLQNRWPAALLAGLSAVSALALAIFIGIAIPQPARDLTQDAPHDRFMQNLLNQRDVIEIDMRSRDPKSLAKGWVHWNPLLCGGCLVLEGLLPEPGKTFQLWAIKEEEEPVSLGTFTTDKNGSAHIDVRPLKDHQVFERFTITLEPPGGVSLRPSGPIQLVGSFF